MERSKLRWEDVIQYEEVLGYGQQVWKNEEQYYFVTEEGGIAPRRVIYELSNELFKLLENKERDMGQIHFYLRNDGWPPNITQLEADRIFLKENIELLKNDSENQSLFTRKELEELLPKGSVILACSDE